MYSYYYILPKYHCFAGSLATQNPELLESQIGESEKA
jgi:hypothetical protein